MNPNNNQQLWESNFSSFDVPSNDVNNQSAESKPAENSVVGDHHKSRLDALKKKPETIQQPTSEGFTPPAEATTPVESQPQVEDLSFEGISLTSNSDPVEQEGAKTNHTESEKLENKNSSQPVEQVTPTEKVSDLIDPSNEFEEIEKPTNRGFVGLTNSIASFFRVEDGSKQVGKASKKGGVVGLHEVEQSLNSK